MSTAGMTGVLLASGACAPFRHKPGGLNLPPALFLETIRVGQLTGSTDPTTAPPERPRSWPLLVDAQGWPLLNDTGAWGAIGVDLGANTEHSDGRLYVFFGDTTTELLDDKKPTYSGNPQNADLVVWTDDRKVLRHGGHLAQGWTFVLPFQPTAVKGQPDWRFCANCNGLFWNGDRDRQFKGICPKDHAPHVAAGWTFVLPYEPTNVQGQPDWRYCGRCAGLFWAGDRSLKLVCPTDGKPHAEEGWRFVLPFKRTPDEAIDVQGQSDWRFCGTCAGLFFDGYAHKGLCAGAEGGGIYLHPVLNDRPVRYAKTRKGKFDPFAADSPVGLTHSLEVPNGAFSHAGKVYVFAGIAEAKHNGGIKRDGDPTPGCYLVSKQRPDLPGVYKNEFLFSPRIGWCPRDQSRDRLESHEIRGFAFVLSHDVSGTPTRQANWRFCRKCSAMFHWDGESSDTGRCFRGDSHEAEGANYVLSHGIDEDRQTQGKWRRCHKCRSLFWNGDSKRKGLCPGGGSHQSHATGPNFLLPHSSIAEERREPQGADLQANWRFCGKCGGLFYDGDDNKGDCPKDRKSHDRWGFNFLLQHHFQEDLKNQGKWRHCWKCSGLFWAGSDRGICPKDRKRHDDSNSWEFFLRHHSGEDSENQGNWRHCWKCAGLFWDGYPEKGFCPRDGKGHDGSNSFDFVLPHNPGEDPQNQGGWRFCTKCHGLVWTRKRNLFAWVSPWVVRNRDHQDLPASPEPLGVVMFGFFYDADPGIRLAWMPLKATGAPRLEDVRYYSGKASQPWSSEADEAAVLFKHGNTYTHLSAAWLEGPMRWILLYSHANDEDAKDPDRFRRAVVARIGTKLTTPSDWSEEIEVFKPSREKAYGKYMHMPGPGEQNHIHPDVPPMQDPSKPEHPGWAYGAFLLNRFTEWDASSRDLGIYYLLSLSSPYQVQLMHTRLRLP